MRYRRELDGLRAIAVLSVIFFHAGFNLFSGGFVGVDVFFVISGYLITSIILIEKSSGSFSMMHFYERRARRILPALFFMILICLPVAWFIFSPSQIKDFFRSLIYVPIFLSNVDSYKHSGYFDMESDIKPLLHTWSLAVEEQYYIFFPLLISLLWKFAKKSIPFVLIAIIALSLGYAEFEIRTNPSAAFYLLPARIWEIMIGALLAHYLLSSKEESCLKYNQLLSILGFSMIIFAVFFFDKNTPFPGLYALVPTIGTALVLAFGNQDAIVGKILSHKIFVSIGLISYSAYLWHQPLLAFSRVTSVNTPNNFLLILLIIAALLFGYLSWRFIEQPFRLKNRISKDVLLFSTGLVSSLLIAIGVWGKNSSWFAEHYFNKLSPVDKSLYIQIENRTHSIKIADSHLSKCNFISDHIDQNFIHQFSECAAVHKDAIIVLGDSHAMNIYNAYRYANLSPFVVGLAQGGCRPYENKEYCNYGKFYNFLIQHKQAIKQIIYHQSGAYLVTDSAGRVDSDELFNSHSDYKINVQDIAKVEAYLNKLSKDFSVIWLGPFAESRVDFENYKSFRSGFYMNENSIKLFKTLDDFLIQHIKNEENRFEYISLSSILDIEDNFLKTGDCITFRDKDHFSPCGEFIVGQKIKHSGNKSLVMTPSN